MTTVQYEMMVGSAIDSYNSKRDICTNYNLHLSITGVS